MQTPEGKVKQDIKRVLKAHNVWYYMPVQNGMGVVGIPDFVCCFHGRFVGIEAKAEGKQPTANQQRVGQEIVSHGGAWMVARSGEDVEAYINSQGDELREAVWQAVHDQKESTDE